ncbi:antirestriction protein ArdA [Arcanobacterium canis]
MSALTLTQAEALPTAPKVQPAVWLGCLSCYNSGRLIGRWFPCDGIEDVTLADVHGGAEHVFSGCEEVWCMDSELLPAGTGEMCQARAAQWGEVYAQVGKARWSALLAWVETGCYVADADRLPCVSDFEDAYQGEWDTFDDYATQLAEDIGLTDGWPEEAERYFNWEAWTRDLRFDYTVADAPDGGVFVFRSC